MTPATILAYDGIKQPVTEWALDYGITPSVIIARLERGMSTADAITTPMVITHAGQRLPIFSDAQVKSRSPRKTHELNGERKTLTEWAKHLGISKNTLKARLDRMTIAEAVAMGGLHGRKPVPGVVADFAIKLGTGAGSTAQETPNLTFSQEAAE